MLYNCHMDVMLIITTTRKLQLFLYTDKACLSMVTELVVGKVGTPFLDGWSHSPPLS